MDPRVVSIIICELLQREFLTSNSDPNDWQSLKSKHEVPKCYYTCWFTVLYSCIKPLTPRADFGRSPPSLPERRWGGARVRTMWGLLSAVCQFLNFSNRTVIKGDILKDVKQSQKNFLQNRPLKSATKKLWIRKFYMCCGRGVILGILGLGGKGLNVDAGWAHLCIAFCLSGVTGPKLKTRK